MPLKDGIWGWVLHIWILQYYSWTSWETSELHNDYVITEQRVSHLSPSQHAAEWLIASSKKKEAPLPLCDSQLSICHWTNMPMIRKFRAEQELQWLFCVWILLPFWTKLAKCSHVFSCPTSRKLPLTSQEVFVWCWWPHLPRASAPVSCEQSRHSLCSRRNVKPFLYI